MNLFGPDAAFDKRLITDYDLLQNKLKSLRVLDPDLKIGLTSGTFDMLHLGHTRYLRAAKQHCDILVVGVDSDDKVRKRKGPKRPLDPHAERYEVVCDTRYPDIVVPKEVDHPRWHLIRTVEPDVLIISEREYEEPTEREQLRALVAKWGGKIEILPSQAVTSTSARLRILMLEGVGDTIDAVRDQFNTLLGDLRSKLMGGSSRS